MAFRSKCFRFSSSLHTNPSPRYASKTSVVEEHHLREQERQLLESLGNHLAGGISHPNDWYSLKTSDLESHGVKFSRRRKSLATVLETLFVEHQWQPWRFTEGMPSTRWQSIVLRRAYLDYLCKKLQILNLEDWYRVRLWNIRERCGRKMIDRYYGGSLFLWLQEMYPDYRWQVWRFQEHISNVFWENVCNRRFLFDSIAEAIQAQNVYELHDRLYMSFMHSKHGSQSSIDRKRLSTDRISIEDQRRSSSGSGIPSASLNAVNCVVRHYFGGNLVETLRSIFPECSLYPWNFPSARMTRGFWQDSARLREALDDIAYQLNLGNGPEGWYRVQGRDIVQICGAQRILGPMCGSLSRALQCAYPESSWKPWKFRVAPRGSWTDIGHIRCYAQWLSEQLHLGPRCDWSIVSVQQLLARKGARLIFLNGGWISLRERFSLLLSSNTRYNTARKVDDHLYVDPGQYCQLKLDNSSNDEILYVGMSSSSSQEMFNKGQNHLYRCIVSLFPTYEVMLNYRKYSQLVFQNTEKKMEIDIFVPLLSLVIEYQGQQHYDCSVRFGLPRERIRCDEKKKNSCIHLGLTYLTIPYWWDERVGSLVATLRTIRPDLLISFQSVVEEAGAIPEHNPQKYSQKIQGSSIFTSLREQHLPITVWRGDFI